MAQKRLSDELFKDLLFKELNSGNEKAHLKTNFFQLIQTSYSLDKTRGLKLHDLYYPEWVNLQNKANSEETISQAKQAVKTQINTKNERLAILQKQIDELMYDLQHGMIEKGDGSLRELNPVEKSKLRQVIKEIQSEISKIEGDYAVSKTETKITGLGASAVIVED